jgi:streptomycin 6-kinase
MFPLPESFTREMLTHYGEAVLPWIAQLPDLLAEYARRWALTIYSPFTNLTYNYLAPATRADGTAVVLKVCPPTGDEFQPQAEALRLFGGHGMVQLLEADPTHQILLLERLLPGRLLTSLEDDEQATSIAATVIRQMGEVVPGNYPFPTVYDWGKGFLRLRRHYQGGCGPFPRALLEEAETLFAELSVSMATPVLLHGDLHHDNILAGQRQPWLAIDPKGLVGEPAYETGALLRNPLPQLLHYPEPGRVLARRVDQLAAELQLDRARIRGWGLAQSVLSMWWSIEDEHTFSEGQLICANLIAAIKV